jgi:hypothetical protein
MSASRLKTLRIRVDHLALGIGGVVLVVAAVLGWRAMQPDRDQQAEIEQGLERVRAKQGGAVARGGAVTKPPRFVRGVFSGAPQERGEGTAVFEAPPQTDPGELDAAEAVDSFEQVIGELEAALESRRKLSKDEVAEFYNRATGSFTALSSWVDPNDPSERAMMDDAYAQMISLMRELKIRPPAHDTDVFLRER